MLLFLRVFAEFHVRRYSRAGKCADSVGKKSLEPFSGVAVPRALELKSKPTQPWRTTMSRKTTLRLAAAATLAVAMLSSQADARGFGGFGGGGRAFGGGRGIAMARFTGHGGGHTLTPILPVGRGGGHPVMPGPFPFPGRPGRPGFPGHWVFHHHDHGHWVFRGGRWIVIDDVVEEEPVVAPVAGTPGPCTCLTKTYTQTGLVVFADVCTKESASAPVDSTSDATQVPTTPVAASAVPMTAVPTAPNYAGRTYEDYLSANPQAAQPPAPKN
jgi:hypothetical protein